MLGCERWTLTHSWVWAAAPLELGLGLALLPGPGLVATWASSDAEVRDDGDGEPEADGEPDVDGELDAGAELDCGGELAADGELGAVREADGEGDTGVLPGAEEVEEPDGDGDGDGESDGFGVGDFEGVGVGEGEAAAGRAWHLVSVLAFAEVPVLRPAAASFSALARAVPGKLASTPRTRNTPASKLSAVTRARARRIRTACLRCSSGLLGSLPVFGATR